MSVKGIFFDLDGTLLPMDQDAFTYGYFKMLAAKVAHTGIDPKKLVDLIWAGTAAMVKNKGTMPNVDAFWGYFSQYSGVPEEIIRPLCDDFYSNEFKAAKKFTQENPLAVKAVAAAHKKAEKVVLSTNPIFPMPGQITRMNWVGLSPDDFDLVTSYETDCFCKPNPAYFTDICRRMNLDPSECLVIGNDEMEDMVAATAAGLSCYLVTDSMIPCADHPWQGPKGTFAEMIEYIENL